jgi:hypothetical protein
MRALFCRRKGRHVANGLKRNSVHTAASSPQLPGDRTLPQEANPHGMQPQRPEAAAAAGGKQSGRQETDGRKSLSARFGTAEQSAGHMKFSSVYKLYTSWPWGALQASCAVVAKYRQLQVNGREMPSHTQIFWRN